MKRLFILLLLTYGVSRAQTPQTEWSQPTTTITGWVSLDGQLYPYYLDNTNFIVYQQLSLTQRFKVALPSGETWTLYPGGIPDITGDKKQDIWLYGWNGNLTATLYIDGSTGSIVYSFVSSSVSYQANGLPSDANGDGKNDIIMKETSGSTSNWVVYATNGIATSITQQFHSPPTDFSLSQNYPNPFNPSTTIRYQTSDRSDVHLEIYDSIGRLVRTFNLTNQSGGAHTVVWDGRDFAGHPCASGAYFYRLVTKGQELSNKMLLLK